LLFFFFFCGTGLRRSQALPVRSAAIKPTSTEAVISGSARHERVDQRQIPGPSERRSTAGSPPATAAPQKNRRPAPARRRPAAASGVAPARPGRSGPELRRGEPAATSRPQAGFRLRPDGQRSHARQRRWKLLRAACFETGRDVAGRREVHQTGRRATPWRADRCGRCISISFRERDRAGLGSNASDPRPDAVREPHRRPAVEGRRCRSTR